MDTGTRQPTMIPDMQLGEPYDCVLDRSWADARMQRARYCVIWVDGCRFEGTLYEQPGEGVVSP